MQLSSDAANTLSVFVLRLLRATDNSSPITLVLRKVSVVLWEENLEYCNEYQNILNWFTLASNNGLLS
jgi:hypothetical protein